MSFSDSGKARSVQQACNYRIDLPCYPKLWTEGLVVEIELLLMVEPTAKGAQRFKIVDDCWAIIDSTQLRLNDPLSSSFF